MPTDYKAMMDDVRKANLNTKIQFEMHKEWDKFCKEIVNKIDNISKQTPTEGSYIREPQWWLHMQEVRKQATFSL